MDFTQHCEDAIEPVKIPNYRTDREQAQDRFMRVMHTGDYGAMLGLGLRHMTMARIDGTPYALIAARIADHCPAEIKRNNPEKLLRLAYEMYAGGLADEYDRLMPQIRDMIPSLPLPESEKRHLMGEWLIISALPYTRNIKRLIQIYEQAAEMMRGPSTVIDEADSITLGIHGMPGVYLLRPGMADAVRPLIPRLAALFSRFTGEPLCGLEELYEGSLAYYRGNLVNARVLTCKAIYLLEKTKQDALQISAGEQLAMIATRQGDVDCFEEAVEYLDAAAERSINRDACRCLVTLVRSGLFNTLGRYQDTPGWLKTFSYASWSYGTGPFVDKNVAGNEHFAPVSFGVACWFHVQYLAESGQYLRAVAALEVLLQRVYESEGVLILELYFTLLAACCHMAVGDCEKARQYVDKAVELALPDGFIMPLGNFSQHLNGMVEEALAIRDKSMLEVLRRINGFHVNGIRILQTEYLKSELPESLTRREQDVARLAAKGLRNSEIAKALSVSESTVRAHLRSVFQKLEIDRRAKLADKLKRQ